MKSIKVRDLVIEDIYYKDSNGLLQALYELSDTEICMTTERAKEIFYSRQHAGIRTIVVTIDEYIVGTASLIIEDKFLHSGSREGHVEDVAVAEKYQRTGIGKMLMEEIIRIGTKSGCYKLILYCNDDKQDFYKKIGFYNVCGMRIDLPKE